MYFRMLHDETTGSMTYLLADLASREAVLIDPRGGDVAVLMAMLGEYDLRLSWILKTHEHDAVLPRRELHVMSLLKAPQVVHDLPSASTLTFGNEHVTVISTPGHTAGCLSFLWRDRLFCGGLLEVDGCPHQSRPEQPQALWDSVHEKVFTLPAETLLFSSRACSGRVVSTVLEQRLWSPWFAGTTRDEFLARMQALPVAPPPKAPARRRGPRRWAAVAGQPSRVAPSAGSSPGASPTA